MSGLQILSSARQQELSASLNGLARSPSAPPAHLSRVLYIPPHDSFFSSLAVHDLSAEYEHAIRHAPLGGGHLIGPALMGSRLFVTRLATMRRPRSASDGAEYVVRARLGVSGEASLSVRSNGSPPTTETTMSSEVTLPSSTTAEDFQVSILDNPNPNPMQVSVSFPVPDTVSSAGTARHPYFLLLRRSAPSLQWQMQPIEDGPLRYTLVELSSPVKIRAIYHHVGRGSSLSMPFSEGVLLVSGEGSEQARAMEVLVLASLLGR
ncbi:hypothetical protein CP533_6274 [Ophiocordyceps camponoti-saundersi (nom. inval.)]|nr:hypothetical protein CP533_6274 [Ophiocordyceps camponoti-saundersi (nom. inval.)]